MLRGVLEAQAPPRQSATDTISTYCNRLNNATLLEDRRQAILGLRSFAKEFPASVASGSLRGLITCLIKGVDDVDTGKIILETLLMLFHPNEDSPEASDDIALWLADEFSMRQDNIPVLLELLEKGDFYSKLYSLQLLSAISSARLDRTQECILSAPLGTGRLVATLDDPREPIKSAGLMLLNDITQSSAELQKIVAFENAFDRIFSLIQAEGSLTYGGILVQDCLTLLANLLQLNASNQSLFRETGFVIRLAKLFDEGEPDGKESADDALGPALTKERNLWGILAVLRMFLIKGSLGTQANQIVFEKHGILQAVLNLGFNPSVGTPIRAEALRTCADIIRSNSKIQEAFAFNQVTIHPPLSGNGDSAAQANGLVQSYVIDALLDLALSVSTTSLFDVRYAACECVEAYFEDHRAIRLHFLDRAIQGHQSGGDETSNILTILIGGPKAYQWIDPYRIWFSALLISHLLFEDGEAKGKLREVSEGNADQGEEVVGSAQVITGNLIAAYRDDEDSRIAIAYAELLCTWLFEDTGSVNEILGEGSMVQSLIQICSRGAKRKELAQGLCAVLLGICYEFSTKDSPIPRRKLQPMLVNGPGREQYLQKIARLREHPALRDFEVLPQDLTSASFGTLPEVYFDQTFVDFIKDNFSRFVRALDRDPGVEVAHAHEGVDRDLVDELRSQVDDKKQALEKAESSALDLDRKLNQEQAEHRRTQDTCNAEVARIRNINTALQKGQEAELERLHASHQGELQNLSDQHSRQAGAVSAQAQKSQDEAVQRARLADEQHQTEIERLEKRLSELEKMLKTSEKKVEVLQQAVDSSEQTVKQRESQFESLKDAKKVLEESIELNTVNVRRLEDQTRDQETKIKQLREAETKLQANASGKEKARCAAQSELDDLLMVLGDLEEKRTRDKAKLKELGAETSDDEEEEDEEDEQDEEEDEDGDETGAAKFGDDGTIERGGEDGSEEEEDDEVNGSEDVNNSKKANHAVDGSADAKGPGKEQESRRRSTPSDSSVD